MPRKLFGLGSGTPSRFPYEDRPQSGPGIGASSGQVVRARLVIIFGADGGLFVYSGIPAKGNLVASISAAGGTDPYGNVYLPGVVSYKPFPADLSLYASLNDGKLSIGNGPANDAGPWQELFSVVNNTVTGANVMTSAAELDVALGAFLYSLTCGEFRVTPVISRFLTGDFRIEGGALVSVAGTVANPTVVKTDTWQTITSFSNGWTSNGQCRVQLLSSGLVKLQLNVNAGVIASGTTICTVPAADYDPVGASQFLDCQTRGGTAMVNGPGVQITTGGNIQAEGLPTSTTGIRVNGDYALD